MGKTRKDQRKYFSKVAAVKSNARDRVGQPKATITFTSKKNRKPKYPDNFEDLIGGDEK